MFIFIIMKIIAWNVNSLRAILKKPDLINLLNNEDPDVFCMGETKLSGSFETEENTLKVKLTSKYFYYWNLSKVKMGYSGTAILTKKEPINVIYGLKVNNKEYDYEGRVITCEFLDYYIVHVYTPNSGELLARLNYRTTEWDPAFIKFIYKLQKNKPVILCGDVNTAREEIDLKNPKVNLRSSGFTIEERESYEKLLLKNKMIDTFRYLHPDLIKYSYWTYRFNCRYKKNILDHTDKNGVGWRIDVFLLSSKLLKKIIKSDILMDIFGSDHAPVILEIDL
jgi:exodeoxyribonuclease-3